MNLEKLDGESNYDYQRRIIYGKLVDKTLSDVDYAELSKYVYGQSYSSDVARRMFYGSKKTLDMIQNERINEIISGSCEEDISDVFDEFDKKSIELQKERQRFLDQRREFNKLVASEGRLEHLYERLIDSAKQLPKMERIKHNPYYFEPSECEAVIVFSDWHYGMISCNSFNSYDTDICIKRVGNVVDRAISRIILHKCKKAHIVILGDLINGAIHTSSRVASEELVCDQIMRSSEILANAINEIRQYVDETNVYMTYGNHARTVQNKNDNIHSDNMERLVPWWLKCRFNSGSDDDVIIHDTCSDGEIIRFSVMGHDMCASHGDLDRVKSSPRLLTTLLHKTYGMDLEYIILGDKHHIESFNELGVTSTICGSLCGTDDYANDKRLFSEPSQLMLIVDQDGVDAEYKLKCD